MRIRSPYGTAYRNSTTAKIMQWVERERGRAKHSHVVSSFASCSGRPRADIAAELSQGPLKKVLMEVMTDNALQDCGTFSSRGLVVFVTRSVVIVLILFLIAMIVISWHVSMYVEEVESDTCWARVRKAAGHIVKSNWFEWTAGILILLHLGVNCPKSYAYIASCGKELTAEFLSLTAPVVAGI